MKNTYRDTFYVEPTSQLDTQYYHDVLSKQSFRYTIKEDRDLDKSEKSSFELPTINLGGVLTILGLSLICVLLIILSTKKGLLSKKKIKNEVSPIKILSNEEITEVHLLADSQKLIASALETNDLRLISRAFYILKLKELNKKGLITFLKNKTNQQYIDEIDSRELKSLFHQYTAEYERIWFGNQLPLGVNKETLQDNHKLFMSLVEKN